MPTSKTGSSGTRTSKKSTTRTKRATSSRVKPNGRLVIVESPAKAKTIKKYLGRGYTVQASMGHVRDLPKSKLGVDVEHDFEPKYLIPSDKRRLVKELKEIGEAADEVYPRDRPRPRGRGDRLAPDRGHRRGRRSRSSASSSTRSRRTRSTRRSSTRARSTWSSSTPSRRAASSTAWSATSQPAALEEGPARPLGRAGPVRRAADRRRARARDRGVRPGRVLVARGRAARSQGSPPDAEPFTAGAAPDRTARRSSSTTEDQTSAVVHGPRTAPSYRVATVTKRESAAPTRPRRSSPARFSRRRRASSASPPPHDADRAAALRGRRSRRGRARRV